MNWAPIYCLLCRKEITSLNPGLVLAGNFFHSSCIPEPKFTVDDVDLMADTRARPAMSDIEWRRMYLNEYKP